MTIYFIQKNDSDLDHSLPQEVQAQGPKQENTQMPSHWTRLFHIPEAYSLVQSHLSSLQLIYGQL